MPNPSTTMQYAKHVDCKQDHSTLADWQCCHTCANLFRRESFSAGRLVPTKVSPGKFDVYTALMPDEPFFPLAGRDQATPATIMFWANLTEKLIRLKMKPESDIEKVMEARAIAFDTTRWRHDNFGKWREMPLFPEFKNVENPAD